MAAVIPKMADTAAWDKLYAACEIENNCSSALLQDAQSRRDKRELRRIQKYQETHARVHLAVRQVVANNPDIDAEQLTNAVALILLPFVLAILRAVLISIVARVLIDWYIRKMNIPRTSEKVPSS